MLEVKPDVLIVGAAEGSLGEAIANEMENGPYDFGKVTTVGLNEEMLRLDLLDRGAVEHVLRHLQPDVVVCTAGVNLPADIGSSRMFLRLGDSFNNNVIGPMGLLQDFVSSGVRPSREDSVKKFVAISSNSARIARRGSIPYCASKAALSMALRVAARELGSQGEVTVWGYEPGLLAGTPMSEQTRRDFGTDEPLHRMVGVPPDGIPPGDLAQQIVGDVATFSYAHNGLMIPFDGGEQ